MMCVNDEFFDNHDFAEFYHQFDEKAELRHCHGRRIAICLANTAQTIALILYLKQRGASVLPLHPTMPLTAARRAATVAESHFLIFQDLGQIETLQPSVGAKQPGLIQFSSGTTGAPKRIERSWDDIDEELQQYNAVLAEQKPMTPVITCPITHSYGLLCGVLSTFKRGQVPIILTELNPKYVLRKLQQTPQPLLYSSPTMLSVLSKLLPKDEHFYAVMTSGSVLPEPVFNELKAKSHHLLQQYGCSEAGCISINTDCSQSNNMGRALGHIQIECNQNERAPSEIIVHINNKRVQSHDLGYLDKQGMLRFVSRLDDTINVAGINVYPQEVENVLLDYPDITDAVVFKKPDAFAGERVCLQLVADKPVDPHHIRQWCADKLSPYQMPADITQVDAIERLANGKVNRRLLAENHSEKPVLRRQA